MKTIDKNTIIVNARFLTQQLTGVQRYALEIARRLRELDSSIVFVAPKNIIHVDIATELDVQIIGRGTGYYWEQVELPFYLKHVGSPLLFCLGNIAPLFYSNKVVTIHDIAYVRFPAGFNWKFRLVYRFFTPFILSRSLKIITVSEFSKRELVDFYKVNASLVSVIHNGVSDVFLHNMPIKQVGKRVVLGVSSLDHRKNFRSLIEAFNLLDSNDVQLVIVGQANEVFTSFTHSNSGNVRFLGYLQDAELAQHYASASVFVYPSLYEGFGLPVLEAMVSGVPVVCSSSSSLPEVGGDAVVYCNPNDVLDIKKKIERVLTDDDFSRQLVSRGFRQASLFSWDASAKKHLAILKQFVVQE